MARSTKTGPDGSSGQDAGDTPAPGGAARDRNPAPGHGGYSGLPPGGRRPPPAEPATQQRGWAALAMGVLSLVGLSFITDLRRAVYVIVLALLIGVAAAWLGVSAIRKARRGVTARPRGAVAGTVLGIIGIAFSAILLIVFATFWNELSAYSGCMGGANTLSAQQTCQQQFTRSVGAEVSVLSPRGSSTGGR